DEAYNNLDEPVEEQEVVPSSDYFDSNHSFESDMISSHSTTSIRRHPYRDSLNRPSSSSRYPGYSSEISDPDEYYRPTRNKHHFNVDAHSPFTAGPIRNINNRNRFTAHKGMTAIPSQVFINRGRPSMMGSKVRRIGGSLTGNFQNPRHPNPIQKTAQRGKPFQLIRYGKTKATDFINPHSKASFFVFVFLKKSRKR
ncbi:hypothetical protein SK128_015101, partial [Halocaridina rubra]